MTEPDFPYKKPQPENPPEKEGEIPPSPDIKKKPKPENQLPKNKSAGVFTCRICGRSFNTQGELDLHMGTSHKVAQGKKQ